MGLRGTLVISKKVRNEFWSTKLCGKDLCHVCQASYTCCRILKLAKLICRGITVKFIHGCNRINHGSEFLATRVSSQVIILGVLKVFHKHLGY